MTRHSKLHRRLFRLLLGALATVGAVTITTPSAMANPPCDACQAGTLGGILYQDNNANGIYDGGDTPVSGTVRVLTPEGQPYGTYPVGATGVWNTGSPVDCGNWIVLAESPSLTLTSPSLHNGQHVVSLLSAGATSTAANFGFRQTQCASGDNLLDVFNSGWNEAAPGSLAYGSTDDDWLLTSLWREGDCDLSGGGTVTQHYPDMTWLPGLPVRYFYNAISWATDQANSHWISAWPYSGTPNGRHYYQHCFCLAPGFSDPELNFSLYADDEASVYLNGTLLYQTPPNAFSPGSGPYPLPSETVVDPTPHFLEGANCLTVVVENTFNQVTGFDIVGAIKATDGQCCSEPVPPAALSGFKWFDKDGDGIWDPTEPAISDWPIEVQDQNGNPVQQLVTDASGQYAVSPLNPGTYQVQEDPGPSAGWTQTAPGGGHTVTLVSGQNATHLDFGNQGPICDLIDSQIVDHSSEGPNVCCYDIIGNTTLVDGITGAQLLTTNNVSLFGVSSAFDWLHAVMTGQVDWTPDPGPSVGPGQMTPGSFCAQVSPSATPTGIEVAWLDGDGDRVCPTTLKCGLTVSGQKFNDLNGDGIKDPTEPGIPGWTIVLTLPDGSQITTTTDNNGDYFFDGLGFGPYTISEINQPGWVQTWPSAPGTWTVNPTTDPTTDLDFGNMVDPTGGPTQCVDIIKEHIDCGQVAPYVWTLGFENQSGYDLALVEVVGVTPAGVTFSPNPAPTSPALVSPGSIGSTSFQVSGPGAVPGATVCFALSFHDDLGINCCGIEKHCIELPKCDGCTNAIHGVKYHDVNGNGLRDPGEPTLPGWTIVLDDAYGNQVTTTTDSFGEYWFVGLPHGSWEVSEVQQSGWVQTQPASGASYTFNFTDPNGTVITHADFGNAKKGIQTDPTDPTDPKGAQSAEPASFASATVRRGARQVPMLPLRISAPADEAVTLRSITVAAAGTGHDAADIDEVRLYRDLNGNGQVDAADPQLATGHFTTDNGVLTLTLSEAHHIGAGEAHDLLVAVDFAAEVTASGATGGSSSFPVGGLMLVIGLLAAVVLRPRRLVVAAALCGALAAGCNAAEAPAPPTYQLFLVHVDAVGDASERVIRLADDAPIAGTAITLVD